MRIPLAQGSLEILTLLGVLSFLGFLAHPPVGWAVFVLFLVSLGLFRDPERKLPPGSAGLVVSPADGTVLAIEEVHEEGFMAGPCLRISILSSLSDVHVSRVPIASGVRFVGHRPGVFRAAASDAASELNDRVDVGFQSGETRVLCRLIAGFVARTISCYTKVGDQFQQGERFGAIRYGGRLELFLPYGSGPLVEVGSRVYGTATAIATLPEETP